MAAPGVDVGGPLNVSVLVEDLTREHSKCMKNIKVAIQLHDRLLSLGAIVTILPRQSVFAKHVTSILCLYFISGALMLRTGAISSVGYV